MHEYEIFIEDINPCGGEQYSKKTLIEAEAASPEAAASQAGEAAADPDATADASAAEGGQQTALETTSSQEPKYPVESSTERETLAPDPEMPNAPVD